MIGRPSVLAASLVGLFALPALASAQGFGFGPRFSFVRGDIVSGAASTRFVGGTVRMRSSALMVSELAIDYRTYMSEDLTTRVREKPIQGSLLLFLARSTVSPYVLGGLGIYTRHYDQLDAKGTPTDTVIERRKGWHLGAGLEFRLNRHTAMFGDYRLRFVKFGQSDTTEDGREPVHIPGFEKLKLSHQGSMWTGGIAFYF